VCRKKPPYYLHVNPQISAPTGGISIGFGSQDERCFCGCVKPERQTGKFECKLCHYRSDTNKDIEDHIKKTHSSILKEGTQKELWEQIKGYDESVERKNLKKLGKEREARYKKEKEDQALSEAIKVKLRRDNFTKLEGYKLLPKEVIEICKLKWDWDPYSLGRSKLDKSIIRKLTADGYIEKKGFLAPPELTLKGTQIFDYAELVLGWSTSINAYGHILSETEFKDLLKHNKFTEREISYVLSLVEALKREVSNG
jgi:hypothetical protein